MKKRICCILAVLLFIVLLTGCASDTDKDAILKIYRSSDGVKTDLLRTVTGKDKGDDLQTAIEIINQDSGTKKKIDSKPDYIFEVLNTDGNGAVTDVWVWVIEDKIYSQTINGMNDGKNTEQRERDVSIEAFNKLIK